MQLGAVDVPPPARNEVRLRHSAIGLNFIDVYDRTGLYPMQLPAGLGREAAGVIEALGPGVRRFKLGQRVAYCDSTTGAYATARNVSAAKLVALPAEIADDVAAGLMLKGLTAWFLLRQTYRVRRGDPVLIHAAAGGVGLIAVQWARALGAEVIAVVGSEAKARLVRAHGAQHALTVAPAELAAEVRRITGGRGVPVVYDSVGKDTFFASLDCLRPRGLMVSFGNASGPVPAVAPLELTRRGSLYLTRPALFHYIARPADLARGARELFAAVARGDIKLKIGQRYALADVARAHQDLEARRTTGSTVLIP